MKLKRLRIEQLRQFRQPLEIRDFEAGINLFTGPNESGKSSIVRAIRAAFFERYRSSSVDDLCPWEDSSSSPTVALDFDIGDTSYSLTKSFLHRKRCELRIGTQRLEGADAEDKLAEIFGFQFAANGASKPEHWGIPGLLWIEQGTGQEVHEAVYSATDHLRGALKESLGEVASSGGDEVLERVRAERAILLTSTGKPTGPLSKVASDLEEARARQAALEEQIANYRQQVDTLGNLREEHAKDEAERPWEFFLAELKAAEVKYASIEQLNQKLVQSRNQLAQFEGTLVVLRQQITDFSQQTEYLSLREKALANANERVAKSAAAEAPIAIRRQAAEVAYQNARDALQLARHADLVATNTRTIRDAQSRLEVLETSIKAAQLAQADVTELRKLAVVSEIDKRDLATLREPGTGLRELEIRQATVATRLEFDLEPNKSLTLDGETLSNQGERMLVAAAELGIPGVGILRVTPGGSDLAELAREHDELREAHQALLQRIGVASLDEAEQRYVTYQQQLSDIRQAEQAFAVHAPKGLEALVSEQAEIKVRIAEAQTAIDEVPSLSDLPVLSLKQAEVQVEEARGALERGGQEANLAKQELVAAEANRDNALRERDALLQAQQDPVRKQRQQDAERRLVEMNAERNTLAQLIETLEQQIAEARPEILAQDIERLRRTAEQTQKQFRIRAEEIIRLQTQLESAGAQGLEEQSAGLALQVEQLARRNAELARRAQALDLLLNLLEGKRRELTRRLQAPLQKHLNRYLHLLFPQASLEIDENLTPGPLTRMGSKGEESSDFGALSFGAREQMGVISRLAYADLLQEAGRPTLIILDDALVHSDEQRLGQMKRILFDAAQRHQILLFTCHPAAWRDLGVAPRAIESLKFVASL